MRYRLMVLAVVLALGGALARAPVRADSGAATYHYLLGAGLICALGPSVCPDVAMASNGDTIALSGQGTLSIHPKTASGGGTFVHMHGSTVLGKGTWTATDLLSFDATGSDPSLGLPPSFSGGQAILRVHLVGASGEQFDGILTQDCDLGTNPPGHAEGVRLVVQGALNFNDKVSGGTLFIKQ
ncbi:MAG TPA: hypothetical protein VKV26_08640 [Dehalococcoidia bacterium]|nr:hypothetical protein [Dehalococcoidia bacterium]